MNKTARQTDKQSSFLPDFCNARMAFVVIIMAELLAVVLTLSSARYSDNYDYDLAVYSLFIQFIALSCASALCLARSFLNKLSDPVAASLSYGLVLLISFLIIQFSWWLMREFHFDLTTGESFLNYTLRTLAITAITSALALRYFYIQHQWRKQIQLESKSRLAALQARIRPHFFFNCMNTIASLSRKDARLTEEAVENLADLFRASLQNSDVNTTLEKELELCRQYLSIEQHRLGDRLKLNWQVDELPMQTSIPPLTIQPMLENAIYHGIEPLAAGGNIDILGKVQNALLEIQIRNPIATGQQNEHQGNQLAQENVRLRLSTTYGRNDLFEINESPDEYCVTIRLPLDYENPDR